ncbi:hypothetical protein [Nocardioides jiangxiensis]|uniref:Integrase core domain-containing protein n=1 Tax=Nocardioides jiangxiensis TaxID=3064524 RepID=A0ABT9B0G1_9ACTN|nr:hypothetical protein [Nocardioides sp. WY-20]MDO7868163.1 hypothetical protein [Nocardioides sp. WY-20]
MTDETPAPLTVNIRLSLDSCVSDMAGAAARVLKTVEENGALHVIVEVNGEVERIPLSEVIRAKTFEACEATPRRPFGAEHELMNWIPKVKRDKARALEAHMIDVIHGRSTEGGPYDASTTTMSQRRAAKMAELGMNKSKMHRSIRDYRESGIVGLVPAADRVLDANGALDLDPEVLAVARDFVADQRTSSTKGRGNLHGLFLAELAKQGLVTLHEDLATDAVPFGPTVVSSEKFTKMVNYLNRGKGPQSARVRQQQANRPHTHGARHRAFDFADRIEMDSTPLDVFVRGENGRVKAHAVFAICTSTRYLWVRIVPGAPKGADLALLLWDMAGGEAAVVPGSDLATTGVPTLVRNELSLNAWRGEGTPPAALPGTVVFDHGAEEENARVIGHCTQLGVTIEWARTRQPTDKAYVESAINSFARWCQLVPGHKGNNVENRPHSEPDPVLTVQEFQAMANAWQQDYVTRPHTGLPHPSASKRFFTPAQAVAFSINQDVHIRAQRDPTRLLGLLHRVEMTPQDEGIRIGRQTFVCEDFEQIIRASAWRTGKREPMTFYFDPGRMGRIYWPTPDGLAVKVLKTPAEAGVAVMPFADVRAGWEARAQGAKELAKNSHAARVARHVIHGAEEAMRTAAHNVVSFRTGKVVEPSVDWQSGGWNLADALAALDAEDPS